MKKPEQITNQETIDWLLEDNNPSVKYLTLTKILNKSKDNQEVLSAKQAIMETGIVPQILSKQNEAGYWGEPQKFYTAKYSGTVWQLMILAELGAEPGNTQISKAAEFILEISQDVDSYGFAHKNAKKTGGGLHSEVIPCLTGNMLWSLINLGFIDDNRIRKGIEWICKYQRCDDGLQESPKGWPYDRYQMCWGKHSCHMGVIKSLKALAAIPKEKRDKAIDEKIKNLAEYMLVHHIYKQSHNLNKTSKPGWLKLGFPLMYQTDILEILGILTDLGYKDVRMNEAIEILKQKQNEDKRWNLENTFNGRMVKNIEDKGRPSKWITLKAINVLIKN
jgi:hypothetical protein